MPLFDTFERHPRRGQVQLVKGKPLEVNDVGQVLQAEDAHVMAFEAVTRRFGGCEPVGELHSPCSIFNGNFACSRCFELTVVLQRRPEKFVGAVRVFAPFEQILGSLIVERKLDKASGKGGVS